MSVIRRPGGWTLLVTLWLAAPTRFWAAQPLDRLVIWDFDHSLANSLGGKYNVFSKSPSWARTYLDPNVHVASSAHSLRVTAHRDGEGFCGVWLDFYPGDGKPQRVFDASAYGYLSFWIRGPNGAEDSRAGFEIKLVDEPGEAHEDSVFTQPVERFLKGRIGPEWQRVLIPLADFPQVDPGRLVRLVLIFTKPGDYRFYLDDISFDQRKFREDPAAPATSAVTARPATAPLAMWVWNTSELLESSENTRRLFEFCARQNISDIYLAIELERSGGDGLFTIASPQGYHTFLERAHQKGLRVEALAGDPEWAVDENHRQALAAVRAVVGFNRVAPQGARFDGIHLDVEPYVLAGFADRVYQKQLLTQFLEMIAQCAALARSEGHLAVSCDVPWWFYPADSEGRKALTVTFGGTAETVGEHLTDLLASVTIMDYHNEADGAGGVIASGSPALSYAARKGKQVMVGVETFSEPDATDYFAFSLPASEFHQRLAASGLRNDLHFEGYNLYASASGPNVILGLWWVSPPKEAIETALAHLARKLGFPQADCCSALAPTTAEIRAMLASDPEWIRMDPAMLRGPQSHDTFTGFRLAHRMEPNTTFHGLRRQVFEEETQSTIEWLRRYPSFGGLAIHFYDSFRSLMETP